MHLVKSKVPSTSQHLSLVVTKPDDKSSLPNSPPAYRDRGGRWKLEVVARRSLLAASSQFCQKYIFSRVVTVQIAHFSSTVFFVNYNVS